MSKPYSPPGEALREWRYSLSPGVSYSESRLRLPGVARTTVRTRGAELNGVWMRDMWTIAGDLGYEQVSASGVLKALDHEVLTLHVTPMYRLTRQDTTGVDVDLVGSLQLAHLDYDEKVPGIPKGTTYLAPGAGLALGRWIEHIGQLRAAYVYQPSIALGSNRRQLNGDRVLDVHSVGLACHRPWFQDDQGGVLSSSFQGIYQSTPGLPSGWDGDSISLSGSLDYLRENWGVSLIVGHTLEDDQQGSNWTGRILLHWNL